jgi:hypothetical protein
MSSVSEMSAILHSYTQMLPGGWGIELRQLRP